MDPYTLLSPANLIKDFPSINNNGLVNVVIEMPAGRTDKWELRKSDGALTWNIKKDKPRVVKYIGCPGNYGMIPQTILPKELDGDDDALDAIVLGPPLKRGSAVKARLIGILKLLDNGEQDDKLITVNPDSPFIKVMSIKELDQSFNGITDILETWFINYKGPGQIQSKGFGDTKEDKLILQKANTHFLNRNKN
jgi:inorganic pyrophosphatase